MPYRRTPRTEQRLAATREAVIEAAHELIAAGGYREATMAAVAARAGVATGSVYRHFPSKGQLFAEVFRRASQREVEAAQAAALAAPGGASSQIEAAVRTFALRATRRPRLAWALLAEPVDPAVEAERLRFRRAHRDNFAGLIQAGIDRGDLPRQNAPLVAAALVGALGEALLGPLSTSAPPPVDELTLFCIRAITSQEHTQDGRHRRAA